MKGYGACWVGAFDESLAAKAVNVPDGIRPVAIIPIGFIDGPIPELRRRKPLTEVVVSEKF